MPLTDTVAFDDAAAARTLWNPYFSKASFILFFNVVFSCLAVGDDLINRDLENWLATNPVKMTVN